MRANEEALRATIWNLRRATNIHGDIFVSNAKLMHMHTCKLMHIMLIQQKLVLHINPRISASRNRGELRLLFSEVGTTDSSD